MGLGKKMKKTSLYLYANELGIKEMGRGEFGFGFRH